MRWSLLSVLALVPFAVVAAATQMTPPWAFLMGVIGTLVTIALNDELEGRP